MTRTTDNEASGHRKVTWIRAGWENSPQQSAWRSHDAALTGKPNRGSSGGISPTRPRFRSFLTPGACVIPQRRRSVVLTITATLFIGLFTTFTAAREARVVLKNGDEVRGEITFSDSGLTLKTDDGEQRRFSIDEVHRCHFEIDTQATKELNFGEEQQARDGQEERPENDDQDRSASDDEKLPDHWQSIDIGKMLKKGRAVGQGNRFLLEAHDRPQDEEFSSFHMVYTSLVGNCEISARVVSISQHHEDSSGAIILRGGLDERNSNHMLSLSPEDGVTHRAWKFRGGVSKNRDDPAIQPPYWLRLIRRGDRVESQFSADGRSWQRLHEHRSGLPDGITAGLAVTARNEGLNQVFFDNVHLGPLGSRPNEKLPPRVHLTSGSVLSGRIATANGDHFEVKNRWFGETIPTNWIARVSFILPQPGITRIVQRPDRRGVQLRNGDFIDSTLEQIKDDLVISNSVLFGRQSFRIYEQADSLLIRSQSNDQYGYRVTLSDGSIFVGKAMALHEDTMDIQTELLGKINLPLDDVEKLEIK